MEATETAPAAPQIDPIAEALAAWHAGDPDAPPTVEVRSAWRDLSCSGSGPEAYRRVRYPGAGPRSRWRSPIGEYDGPRARRIVRSRPVGLEVASSSSERVRPLEKGGTMIIRECEVRYKRTKLEAPGTWPRKITSSRDVVAMLQELARDLPTERMWVVLLSSHNAPVGIACVAMGGTSSAAIEIADVFRPAICAGAVGIIIAHNHPSGAVDPSESDVAITRRIRDGGKLLGITVLDHVIVGEGRSFSFLDAGLFATM